MKVSTPFNKYIPKGIVENLKWRKAVYEKVLKNPPYADVIKSACARDPLFFINGFGWTYDPRRQPSPKLPFILYDFQEDAILEIIKSIGDHDLLIEKSRDMGASWCCIVAIHWCWLFKMMQSFLFVSRVEDYVDKTGNPKALMWKFDYLLNSLPLWLQPVGYNTNDCRSKLHIENPENGSVVDGESTTGNVARGDRRTAILLDEFAAVVDGHNVLSSTRDATNCRIFNSTPSGTNNAFYDIRQTDIQKLRLHWSHHPIKSKGIYNTNVNGQIHILDDTFQPIGFEPILDGKLRSPWYDNECKRAAGAKEIAQELDIDYLGSGYQYFDAQLVQQAIQRDARPYFYIGDLEYDDITAEPICFRDNPSGNLRLWCLLDKNGRPSRDHKYTNGIDVSAGTGASNSCSVGWDNATNEKVFEYVNPHIRPEAFAKQAVALAKWFGDSFMIWESFGPGRQFGSRIMELTYGNIYYRKNDESVSGKTTDVPGWAPTKETKLVLIGAYRVAIEKGECVNRSKIALEETLEYIHTNDGGVEHSRAINKTDPSGAKANHGDRVIADALAWKGMHERGRRPEIQQREVPVGCLRWRQLRRETEKRSGNRELSDGWR